MEKDVYSRHIQNYETHWWFKARKNIIYEILKSKIKKKKYKILDYGAGSGTNINMLAKAMEKKLVQENDKNLLIKRASEFSLTKISDKYLELFNR